MKKILVILFVLLAFITMAQETPDINYFNKNVIARVMAYNAETDRLNELYKSASQQQSSDTVNIKLKRMEAVQQCFQVPQDFIKAHLGSSLCIEALKMLGEGETNSPVQIENLEKLFGSLEAKVKNSEEGKEYELQLMKWGLLKKIKEATEDPTTITGISKKEVRVKLSNTAAKTVTVKKLTTLNKPMDATVLAEKVKASTLILNMSYLTKEGTIKVSSATAYVIDESGICVTNYHVMEEYVVKEMYLSLFTMNAEGKAYPVTKILSCSESADLVIFKVDIKQYKLTPLPIGEWAVEGTEVSVLSHPNQTFYQLTKGKITNYIESAWRNKPCLEMNITAEFTVGSSGGPVVDSYGNLVGTVSRYYKNGVGGIVRTCIPVSALKELLTFN